MLIRNKTARYITTLLMLLAVMFQSAFANIENEPIFYDIVIAGAGTGGVSAAIQAARMGSTVLLVEETDWVGGQMTSAGVTSMDGNYDWNSGIYKEFTDKIKSYYSERNITIGRCYWTIFTICFEPHVGKDILMEMINQEANITLLFRTTISSVQKDGNVITGVTTNSGLVIETKILIDATEYGDVIPLTGATYRIGNNLSTDEVKNPLACVQDITYTAVIKQYPNGAPSNLIINNPPPGYTTQLENAFKGIVSNSAQPGDIYPVNWSNFNYYRGMPNSNGSNLTITKTGVNWANDFSDGPTMSTDFIEDLEYRKQVSCDAKLRTIQFIYFIQNVLGKTDWSVSIDEGYGTPYNTSNLCNNIPLSLKEIESNIPLIPYVRESRRGVGLYTLTAKDLYRTGSPARATKLFPSNIAIGDYPNDLHNCSSNETLEANMEENSDISGSGIFEVPMGVLISSEIDGLLFAEKNISQTRISNGATRLQPITMLIGQAAGALASVSVQTNTSPKNVNYTLVQKELIKSGDQIIPFIDSKPNDKYFKDVQLMALRGIMNGYGNFVFGANDNITRGQMAVVLIKSLEIPVVTPTGIFADVPVSDAFAPYIETLYLTGITAGCSASPRNFCPNNYITNAETSVFVMKSWMILNSSVTLKSPPVPTYSDVPIGFWVYSYVEGLAFGNTKLYCGSNQFCPTAYTKRSEVAHLMNSILLLENR